MTAKPLPMTGHSDASDDLIAELAKLMAQDAQGEKPVEPSRAMSPVRIPGGDPKAVPGPRFDFGRSAAASEGAPASTQQAPAAAPTPPALDFSAQPTQQQPGSPEPEPEPEPFRFDFGLVSPKTVAPVREEPTTAPPAAPMHEEEVRAPVAAPTSQVQVPPDPSFMPVDHDSIADLIAAELMGVSEPEAELPPQPAPSVAATPRPAPQPSAGWAPTAVAANRGSDEKPARQPMRPLNLQPAARPEQDRFKVAPVFGLGSAYEPSVAPVVNVPAAAAPISNAPMTNAPARAEPSFGWRQPASPVKPEPQPQVEDDAVGRDPIDEIESLIGNAMRVELERPARPEAAPERSAASPALRSLATPVAPAAPAPQAFGNRKVSGADEAILAAAHATGVEIGWVDTPENSDSEPAPPRRQRTPRAMGITRALAGPLVAVTLLLAAGFGLYWVLGLGRESGPAPLLTADATPTKVVPVVDPDAPTAAQSVVFDEIDGVVPGAEEQLVSRDQADLNEVTQVPPTNTVSEEGLANRKVRTVTVRPDGTIVSGEDSVAGSNILPVARPNVPAVPGAETASEELLASAAPATTATPAVAAPAVTPAPATPAVAVVTPGATVPAVDLAGNALAGKTTVVPLTRPAGLEGPGIASFVAPTSPVNAVVNSGSSGGKMLPPPPTNSAFGASTAPAAAATPAAVAAPVQAATATAQPVEVAPLGNTAPAYAQLASLRTEDEARQAGQNMVTRFGPVFGGANLEVQRVDLGERGIYYRVRVPAASMQDANTICANVKAAGGDCVPM